MHALRPTLLALALLTSGAALAETSTPVDYDHANLIVTATGNTAQAVSFTTPSSSLTIRGDNGYLRPGASYTVTVPVTNTTDRMIDVTTATSVSGSGTDLVTVTPVTSTLTALAAGASGNLTYTVTVADATDAAAFASKAVTITFTLSGSSTSAF